MENNLVWSPAIALAPFVEDQRIVPAQYNKSIKLLYSTSSVYNPKSSSVNKVLPIIKRIGQLETILTTSPTKIEEFLTNHKIKINPRPEAKNGESNLTSIKHKVISHPTSEDYHLCWSASGYSLNLTWEKSVIKENKQIKIPSIRAIVSPSNQLLGAILPLNYDYSNKQPFTLDVYSPDQIITSNDLVVWIAQPPNKIENKQDLHKFVVFIDDLRVNSENKNLLVDVIMPNASIDITSFSKFPDLQMVSKPDHTGIIYSLYQAVNSTKIVFHEANYEDDNTHSYYNKEMILAEPFVLAIGTEESGILWASYITSANLKENISIREINVDHKSSLENIDNVSDRNSKVYSSLLPYLSLRLSRRFSSRNSNNTIDNITSAKVSAEVEMLRQLGKLDRYLGTYEGAVKFCQNHNLQITQNNTVIENAIYSRTLYTMRLSLNCINLLSLNGNEYYQTAPLPVISQYMGLGPIYIMPMNKVVSLLFINISNLENSSNDEIEKVLVTCNDLKLKQIEKNITGSESIAIPNINISEHVNVDELIGIKVVLPNGNPGTTGDIFDAKTYYKLMLTGSKNSKINTNSKFTILHDSFILLLSSKESTLLTIYVRRGNDIGSIYKDISNAVGNEITADNFQIRNITSNNYYTKLGPIDIESSIQRSCITDYVSLNKSAVLRLINNTDLDITVVHISMINGEESKMKVTLPMRTTQELKVEYKNQKYKLVIFDGTKIYNSSWFSYQL